MHKVRGDTRDMRKKPHPSIYNLKKHKVDEEEENLKSVLTTIKKLGNCTTNEIVIRIKTDSDIHNMYLKQEAEQLRGSRDDLLTPRGINNYISQRKRDVIGIRTVQRAVNTLLRYGLIYKHASRRYSLSSKSLKEIRYFPHDFAEATVDEIFLLRVQTVEQTLEEMITRFGAYIFFTLVEAARPLLTVDVPHKTGILDREKLLNSWLENAIPIRKMFDWFVYIYTMKNTNTSGERDEKIAEKLIRVFESKYPQVYKIFKEAKLDVLGEREPTIEEKTVYIENLSKVKLLEPGQKMKWPYFSNNRASTIVVPPDWNEQLTS